MTTTDLRTERLRLTPVDPAERAELHTLFTEPAVRKYLMDDVVVDVDWIDDVIATSQHQFAEASYGLWTVRLYDQQPIIGVCGFVVISQLQLLYAFLPAYWGRGYATEASRAVVDYGFREAGMTEIVAAADEPNTSSFGVMERLGMYHAKTEGGIAHFQLSKS